MSSSFKTSFLSQFFRLIASNERSSSSGSCQQVKQVASGPCGSESKASDKEPVFMTCMLHGLEGPGGAESCLAVARRWKRCGGGVSAWMRFGL